jgi:hypothetical protein
MKFLRRIKDCSILEKIKNEETKREMESITHNIIDHLL